jgi:hypothetical protein
VSPEVKVALITTVVPAVLGGAGWLVAHLLKVTTLLSEVKEQVANTHDTNLREDIDSLGHRIDAVLDGMGAMRLDVSWIRRDHIDLTHRVALIEGER